MYGSSFIELINFSQFLFCWGVMKWYINSKAEIFRNFKM